MSTRAAIRARHQGFHYCGTVNRDAEPMGSCDVQELLIALGLGERRFAVVRQHTPGLGSGDDFFSWLTCACGWNADGREGSDNWDEHIVAALDAVAAR